MLKRYKILPVVEKTDTWYLLDYKNGEKSYHQEFKYRIKNRYHIKCILSITRLNAQKCNTKSITSIYNIEKRKNLE